MSRRSSAPGHAASSVPWLHKLRVTGEPSNAPREGEYLCNGDDDQQGRAVKPLPDLAVGSVRGEAFAGRFVKREYVLSSPRPDGCARSDFPPEVMELGGFALGLA
jgi:hypothetical protein